ncbi:MAG: PEGA domain-containing protein [Trueperaceae bacterium]|nr:PEGA domain-containing protein [Trueperaceae bacterium]
MLSPSPLPRHDRVGPVLVTRSRALLCGLLTVLALLPASFAQISAPSFGTRGEVESELVASFMLAFRSAVSAATGIEVRNGDLITPGIAGSLEPEFAKLIAELDAARFAVSGEIARLEGAVTDPYTVNLIVVDAEMDRSTDLISAPLSAASVTETAAALAAEVASFTAALVELPRGDAGLFVSSEPGDAQIFVDGVSLGRTTRLDVAMLQAGRYRLEVRKEGFLPEVRMIELRPNDTSMLHVILTPISGGSIQLSSSPRARVLLDGESVGTTPLTVAATPGLHIVTLQRDGFADEVREVLVRNFRVTRVTASLLPAAEPLVYWDEVREWLVFVDGVLQPTGHAIGLVPGLRSFELRRGSEVRTYLRAVPENGAYRLDLETGELVQLGP